MTERLTAQEALADMTHRILVGCIWRGNTYCIRHLRPRWRSMEMIYDNDPKAQWCCLKCARKLITLDPEQPVPEAPEEP